MSLCLNLGNYAIRWGGDAFPARALASEGKTRREQLVTEAMDMSNRIGFLNMVKESRGAVIGTKLLEMTKKGASVIADSSKKELKG